MTAAQGERPGGARVIGVSEPEEPLPEGVAPSPHPLPAPPSPKELSARAWEDQKHRLAMAEDPMASANRAQQGSAYTYKPEFAAQSGQAPGEVNVGPMAQNMAANPVARTAVKQDPGTGLYVLDSDKLSKLHSAGIGSLQSQVDAIKNRIASLVGRR
jgi:hypothetical protein